MKEINKLSQLTTIEAQHKSIYDLLSYSIFKDEIITLMDDMQYNKQHNTYRIVLKSGAMINNIVLRKIDASDWEINYIVAEETINYKTKPLPDVHIKLVIGLKPKGAI